MTNLMTMKKMTKTKIKITCISDLHGFKPKLPGGDLLIVAGDLTARDTIKEYLVFNEWLSAQDYDRKIVIAGNHDGLCETGTPIDTGYGQRPYTVPVLANKAIYLCDTGCEYKGLNIWGSPWTPTFFNWHFMKDRGEPIKKMWDLIPDDTDILITHGPPFGILDQVEFSSKAIQGKFAGCEELRLAIERIQPRLHVFGHVHEGYGQMMLKCTPRDITCINACIMDADYRPVNKPINIEL